MHLLDQLTDYLDTILNSISSNLWLSIVFIFLVCIGEAVFIVGLAVPSLPILLLTGSLIAAGKLPFWPIYFAAVAGAVIGDAISYWVGYLFRDTIKTVWPFKNYLPLIARGEDFFKRHGGTAIFIGRFITGVKAVIPGVAGMLKMPWRHFAFINIISSFVWAGVHIVPAMLFSTWLESIGFGIDRVIVYGTVILVVLFLLFHFRRRIGLLFTPFLGKWGKSLEERWRKPKEEAGP